MASARKNLQKGMQELQEVWDTKIGSQFNHKAKQRSAIAVALTPVPHIIMLAFTGFVTWISWPGSSLFSWHPTLMSLAFMLLMAEAVLVFSPWFSPLLNSPRNDKTRWHWMIQTGAMCCAYTGLAIISYNKYRRGAVHYSSWHGLTGIVVCCLLAVQASGGILTMYPDILPFKMKRVLLKLMHASSATFVTFSGAMAAITLALYSTWFSSNVTNQVVWSLCLASPIFMELIVLLQFIRNFVAPSCQKH